MLAIFRQSHLKEKEKRKDRARYAYLFQIHQPEKFLPPAEEVNERVERGLEYYSNDASPQRNTKPRAQDVALTPRENYFS